MVEQPGAAGQLTTPAPTAEPGYTTTEFWGSEAASAITIAAALAADFGVFNLSGGQKADLTMAAVFVVGLVQIGYALARSWRKRGTAG